MACPLERSRQLEGTPSRMRTVTLTRSFRQGSEDWSFAFAGFEWLVGLQEVQVKISNDYDKFRETCYEGLMGNLLRAFKRFANAKY